MASRISPVEALKYQGNTKSKQTHRKGKDTRFPLASMAAANLSRNKGKTFLVILSIAFSAILLNRVLNYTGNMDKETFVKNRVASDFDVEKRGFSEDGSRGL